MAELLANGVIDIFVGVRPLGGADETEGASPILTLTLNGDAFVPGVATNGLNLGEFIDTTLKRAIDGATSNTEIWKGIGLAPGGTAGWARWYANDKIDPYSIMLLLQQSS